MLVLAVLLVAQNHDEITPYTHESGLYFEILGVKNLASRDLNMVLFFNMTLYWKEYTIINMGEQTVVRFCDAILKHEKFSRGTLNFGNAILQHEEFVNITPIFIDYPKTGFQHESVLKDMKQMNILLHPSTRYERGVSWELSQIWQALCWSIRYWLC